MRVLKVVFINFSFLSFRGDWEYLYCENVGIVKVYFGNYYIRIIILVVS